MPRAGSERTLVLANFTARSMAPIMDHARGETSGGSIRSGPPEEAESRKPTSTFTDHIILDANLVADAPAGKVEERRCRKKLSTVGQGDAFGAHEFPAVLGEPSIHGNAIARFQHIRIPSIVLFEHPGATEFYDPTRDRLPLASRISMDTLACGFDQSTFVTVPVSVTGFFQSNSEANG